MYKKLRWLVMIGLALLLAIGAMPGTSFGGEVLFMVDASQTPGQPSKLYVVDFFGSDANLVFLRTLKKDGTSLNRVVALASNYVDTLYFFDNIKLNTVSGNPLGTGFVGWYGINTGELFGFNHQVQVDGSPVPTICQASMSPTTGVLYASSNDTDSIYSVNWPAGNAQLVGQVKSMKLASHPVVNIEGADFAHDLTNGAVYLWANSARGKGAPVGLYKLFFPASPPGDIMAKFIGAPANPPFITGLAIDNNGVMYASTRASGVTPSQIVLVDKTTGAFGTAFNMKKSGVPFYHFDGDLAMDDHAGPIPIFEEE